MTAIVIGSFNIGGAEASVKNILRMLGRGARRRTRVMLLNDPNARQWSNELDVEVLDLQVRDTRQAVGVLRREFKRSDIRVVHAHLTQAIIAVGFASIGLGIRTIPFIHTFGSWKQYPRRKDYIKINLEKLIVSHIADTIVYVSERTRQLHEDILHYPKTRATVISNVVKSSVVHSVHERTTLRLVSVGRLEPVKGIAWVIEEHYHRQSLCDSTWIIVGDGSSRRVLEERARETGAGKIAFVGKHSDISFFLKDADVFFMPSLSEGLPMALLEACQAGLPLLATSVGSIGEIVHDGVNGFLVPVGDGQSLRAAVCRLRNVPTRQRFAEASRRIFKERFDPTRAVRLVEAMIE